MLTEKAPASVTDIGFLAPHTPPGPVKDRTKPEPPVQVVVKALTIVITYPTIVHEDGAEVTPAVRSADTIVHVPVFSVILTGKVKTILFDAGMLF